MRVLLVEDNPGDARLFQYQLQDAPGSIQFEVHHVSCLGEALDVLGKQNFDIIVADLNLPDAQGAGTVDQLMAANINLPLVVMTGNTSDPLGLELVSRGVQDYLVKGQGDGDLVARSLCYAIERKEFEQHLAYLSYYDKLTGLANRELFQERLHQALARCRRQNSKGALLFLDLDRFKSVNDTLGHTAGDQLLIEIGQRLKDCVREVDTIARLGGDEFTIIMEDIHDGTDVSKICEKIVLTVNQPVEIGGQEIFPSTSLGITVFPDDSDDSVILLRNADTAMYRAKESGRNKYQFFTSEMNTLSVERMELETALRHAFENDELFLVYQPKIELQSQQVCGVEVLLRWQHPRRGVLSPLEFIPIAEDTGLIVPIGQWVIREVCEQVARWKLTGLAPLRVAVNLSPRQFRQADMVSAVEETLERTGVDANQLQFEITENLLMEDTDVSKKMLQAFADMGIDIYIDDFGTGYSSLSYLKQFNIDGLKVDRSFIKDIPVDAEDEALTRAIIAVAAALRLKVVAEGVEHSAQVDFLSSEGCDEVQGFHYSRPLTAEQFVDWHKSYLETSGAPVAAAG